MINRKEIIQEYKDRPEEKIIHLLEDDRVVVGEVADSSNKLFYVIRDGDVYTVESAWNQSIIKTYDVDPISKSVTKVKSELTDEEFNSKID